MKKSLLAGVSLAAVALASGVQAADLGSRPSYKAPVLAPAPWSWAGFYIGANVGIASARSSIADDPSTTFPWLGTPIDANKTGVIGGLQAGYNWQFTNLVLGLEGDISFASLNRSANSVLFGGADVYNARLNALGTLRGRVGWAFDRVLVYGTGGVAFASLKNELTDPPSVIGFTASPGSNVTGWTVGGGFEYAFTDHWTAKAEYLHVGFPTRTAHDTGVGLGYVFAFKDSLDIGRVGINYKF